MLENELKNLWKSSDVGVRINVERLANAYRLEKKLHGLDRTIKWRNIREYVASIFVILIFGYYLMFLSLPFLSKLGCIAEMLAGVFISCRIWYVRKQKEALKPELPLLDELKAFKKYMEVESQNLKLVFTWYILPVLPGLFLFYIGKMSSSSQTGFILTIMTSMLVLALIWWMNQLAVKKVFVPLIQELDDQIITWENGEL